MISTASVLIFSEDVHIHIVYDIHTNTPLTALSPKMQKRLSYPRPPPHTWPPMQVRTPLPVYPPPEPLSLPLPSLPSPPRKPAFDAPFTLSTHLLPASYLRTSRYVDIPASPPESASKAERHALLLKTRTELRGLRGSTWTDGYPRVLWNCVNRYVRDDLKACSSTGLTLFFAHANGFPKEVRAFCEISTERA